MDELNVLAVSNDKKQYHALGFHLNVWLSRFKIVKSEEKKTRTFFAEVFDSQLTQSVFLLNQISRVSTLKFTLLSKY